MSEVLLEARQVVFGYGNGRILDGATLSLRRGELLGLVGPNGSGKSTLIRLLLGLLVPQSGEVLLEGVRLSSLPRTQVARLITLVPQETALDFEFSVREIVAMGRYPYLGRFRPEGTRDRQAIAEALRGTQLEQLAARSVHTLSGGERQRVLIARAVAQQTPLILLDEPTANQDVAHQLKTLELVRRLVREGRGALASVHDLSLAARFCDRILFLSQGRIAAEGTPREVITERNVAAYFHVQARIREDEELGCLQVWPVAPLEELPPDHVGHSGTRPVKK